MRYKLIRSKRRTLSLQIDNNGILIVRAPNIYSIKKIEGFISEKQNWISKKQALIKQKKVSKNNYQNGDKFLYLGESYLLKLVDKNEPLVFDNNVFYLNTKYDAKSAFHWFYKKEFIKIALPKLEFYAKKHNLNYQQVRFKAQKTRWGSCSVKNNINLNYLLMMAPMFVIDSVIVHELAHIKHKNHSKDFYTLLKQIKPDYKSADTWLKQHSQKLHNL